MEETVIDTYRDRVHRAKDFILANPGARLSIERVAEIACLSPYHFHRLFRLTVGESIGRFVQRARMEAAAKALRSNRRLTVTRAAFDHGALCRSARSVGSWRIFRYTLPMNFAVLPESTDSAWS